VTGQLDLSYPVRRNHCIRLGKERIRFAIEFVIKRPRVRESFNPERLHNHIRTLDINGKEMRKPESCSGGVVPIIPSRVHGREGLR
jgi:hypothetical protein